MAKGRLSISCWSSNQEPYHGFTISVTDEASLATFLEVEVTPERFAMAIASRGDQECEFELRGLDVVGKRREVKREEVFVPDHDFKDKKENARKAVAKHEVDGWLGCDEDAMNNHRRIRPSDGGTYYRVGFVRFVSAD